ncbi:MAG: hypothetical protein M3Y27_02600 [Acidobacteriota bacterium]|nr:hypothetical protein [Acidobacteriota bacterium]
MSPPPSGSSPNAAFGANITVDGVSNIDTGNTVNLTLAVTFKPNYKGLMYAFSNVVDNAGNASSFPALGAFLVQ